MTSAPARSRDRLDVVMVARGLAESRSRAQALVMAGRVYAGDRRLDKPGTPVAGDLPIEVRGHEHPWVSRGGVKLAHGLDHFALEPSGMVCLDVGASTGGFTHVLLENGATRVYAVDVGHGQLDWRLRQDPRVVVRERVNARYLSADEVPEAVDLVVCDASFISLATLLPAPLGLARPGATLVALIKPQFEVGPGDVGKGGVVRDAALRERACAAVVTWLEQAMGWPVLGLTESPIRGPKGNVEFLVAARRPAVGTPAAVA